MDIQLQFDFYSLFGLVAIGHGIFLLIFIASKYYKSISYRLLSLILFVLLFEIIHDFFVNTKLILYVPHILSTGNFFSYCIGPLIFLYILSLTRSSFKLKHLHLLHFIPFVLYNLFNLSKYLQTAQQKLFFLNYYYSSLESDPRYFFEARGIVNILKGFMRYDIHKIIYVAIAFYFFLAYKKKILDEYSNIEKTNVRWMKSILYGYLIIWLLIPVERFAGFFDVDIILINNLSSLILPLHIYFISFITFSQQNSSKLILKNKLSSESDNNELQSIIEQSNTVFIKEKLYLNPDLTLTILAKKIGVREHALSMAINKILQINFFDYVNKQRVLEAQKLLKDPKKKQYTIEHIGTLSGFSSKATFYRAFVKHTGKTPGQFSKSLS
ncbi:helix-turn-helix domain-containing protein [Pontimicrobium aquaticum]|uniref:Helix-turn-helix domain-containing protein n=1 Tax=Pontimicrobium aquaticum TaxID=2565367 RepID=A0A4U0F0M2_9FLAO|nr:helix-turn-helix domain-containing protein [Pontimicrobium aquaticum]TJY37768.1 helix-turn-helix domain-containing protein [Pontimicrobium aquaticum]